MPIPQIDYHERPINAERLKAVLQYAGSRVLDVGCGNGAYVLKLKDRFEIVGADIEASSCWEESASHFVHLKSRALPLPFDSESFDTLLSFECLEHTDNPLETLKEYRRLLRSNLILTVPNCDITPGMRQSNMVYYHWVDRTHMQFFNMASIQSLLKEAGFGITHYQYINRIAFNPLLNELFGVPAWARWLTRAWVAFLRRRDYHMTCLVVAHKK